MHFHDIHFYYSTCYSHNLRAETHHKTWNSCGQVQYKYNPRVKFS